MQRRNLRIVYDAIGTLADAVGGELNQVELMNAPYSVHEFEFLVFSLFLL